MRLALTILGFIVVMALIAVMHYGGHHQLARYFTLCVVAIAAATNILHPRK